MTARTVAPHQCGGCDTRWYGAKICHCPTCHNSFTTVRAFDTHREGPVEHRRCNTAARTTTGQPALRRLPNGTWCRAGETLPLLAEPVATGKGTSE